MYGSSQVLQFPLNSVCKGIKSADGRQQQSNAKETYVQLGGQAGAKAVARVQMVKCWW